VRIPTGREFLLSVRLRHLEERLTLVQFAEMQEHGDRRMRFVYVAEETAEELSEEELREMWRWVVRTRP
jgi:hypothetical protein